MAWPQKVNASFMQAFWSSWLWAEAVAGTRAKNAKAIAILIFM
jgi:hypothetical protein